MKTITLPPLVDAYVRATNEHDAKAFLALFTEDAVVDDGGRVFHGRDAIGALSQSDIFDVNVTGEVRSAEAQGDAVLLVTKVDGDFDRTGLPEVVLISHRIEMAGDKITKLTCRLAD